MRRSTAAVIAGATVLAGLVGSGAVLLCTGATPTAAARPIASVAAPHADVVLPASLPPTPSATPAVERHCSIAAAAADPALLHFQGRVVDARTGQVLFDRGGDVPSRTASVLKVLTSAAALTVLGPDRRLETTVVQGAEPGQVVLVGGGDPTLSRTPTGTATAYAEAPHLDALAAQVKRSAAALGLGPIRQVVLDSSYFGGATWQPSWDTKERVQGSMPEITALMVDGDRADPRASTSPRGTDPVGRAGSAFARLLGPSVTTVRGVAPTGARRLGVVRSQPVSTLIDQSLIVSDNTLAEALARVTAIASGDGNTFAAEGTSTVAALQRYGIPTTGILVADGSGLSPDNRVPPAYFTALFRLVRNRVDSLGVVYDGLPISGRTGSLSYADRFAGAAARADGAVHAKTGWIDTGYTLAGIIDAHDGTPLTFAFYALGPAVTERTKLALDAITADVWSCGGDLSDR